MNQKELIVVGDKCGDVCSDSVCKFFVFAQVPAVVACVHGREEFFVVILVVVHAIQWKQFPCRQCLTRLMLGKNQGIKSEPKPRLCLNNVLMYKEGLGKLR
jgi:hypothetical protein